MRKHQKPQETVEQNQNQTWTKCGSCLYRYKGAKYYAILRHRGKLIRRSLETDDLALARRKLRTFKTDLDKLDPGVAKLTLDKHREDYEATLTGAESTLTIAKLALRRLCDEWPPSAPREIRKIKPADLKLWLKQYENLSASTTNHIITTTRRFFDAAVETGAIVENPMEKITYRKIPKLVRLTPTPEQFEAIVADLRSQKSNGHGSQDSADTVELSGRLGLGQAELAGICRQHIDLDAGVIKLFRRKTTSAFTIPIYPLAREIIVRRLSNMSADPEARLLPHYNFKKALAGACQRLNLPKFEPRALRRFFITQALRVGIDAPTVASWQGHRDGGALVLRTYGDEVRMDHSQKMAALLAPKPTGGNVVPFKKEAVA
jgi:integrase